MDLYHQIAPLITYKSNKKGRNRDTYYRITCSNREDDGHYNSKNMKIIIAIYRARTMIKEKWAHVYRDIFYVSIPRYRNTQLCSI